MKNENDVVISTRIRFARNIKDYPFAMKMDKTSAAEIIEKVKKALGGGYTETDFLKLSPIQAESYVENHKVSPEFARMTLPHVLLEKDDLYIMVCEEDHIRLQCIKDGLCLEEAYQEACTADDLLLSGLNIAYDNELGFLTHCPTNLGTGMRASVMVFLPALTMTKEINSIIGQLNKLGLTIRGLYGEGSEAHGYLYQISNRQTLGVDESSTVGKLNEIVTQIITYERQARKRIAEDAGIQFKDRITRSLGTLLYSELLSSSEFMSLFANVRMGIDLGIIKEIDREKLDALFREVMPATLTVREGRSMNDPERDAARAKYVKKVLNQ